VSVETGRGNSVSLLPNEMTTIIDPYVYSSNIVSTDLDFIFIQISKPSKKTLEQGRNWSWQLVSPSKLTDESLKQGRNRSWCA
jgi:hypothetical protein